AAELPETDPRPADVAKPGLLRADQTEEPVVVRRPERGLLHLLEPIAGFDAGRARLPVRPQLPTHLLTEELLLLPQLLHHRRVHIQVPALDALDLTRKALLDAEVRRHELPVLAERPGPEPDRLPTHAGERSHDLLRATEILCCALPVDIGHLGLLAHAVEHAGQRTIGAARHDVLVGLVELGFGSRGVLVIPGRLAAGLLRRRRA